MYVAMVALRNGWKCLKKSSGVPMVTKLHLHIIVYKHYTVVILKGKK